MLLGRRNNSCLYSQIKAVKILHWWDKNSCFSLLMFDYHTGLLKRQFLKFHSFSPMRYESRIENPLCFKEQCPRLFGYCSVPSNFSMTPTDIHTFILINFISLWTQRLANKGAGTKNHWVTGKTNGLGCWKNEGVRPPVNKVYRRNKRSILEEPILLMIGLLVMIMRWNIKLVMIVRGK